MDRWVERRFADASQASAARVQGSITTSVEAESGDPALPVSTGRDAYSAHLEGGSVEIPKDVSSDSIIATFGPTEISLGLPVDDNAGMKVGSTVVYDGDGRANDVAVQATPEGVRALVSIEGVTAPRSCAFPVAGDVAQIERLSDGSLVLCDPDGDRVATVAAPWAVDATGAPVPAHFVVSGTTVTQVVDFDAGSVFPITADPHVEHYDWGTKWVAYFNRHETLVAGATAAGAAALCGAATLGVGTGACIAYGAYFSAVALTAWGSGQCVKLTVRGTRLCQQLTPTATLGVGDLMSQSGKV